MRVLIDYIKSCFCKHNWILEAHDDWIYCGVAHHRWIFKCNKCNRIKILRVYK